MSREHHYKALVEWSNAESDAPPNVRTYSRNHTVAFEGKEPIPYSADPNFRGDASKHNPEEMLLGATASCHMLSYLFRCAQNGITVLRYVDNATGKMVVDGSGGRFTEITLHPEVTIKESDLVDKAKELHHQANKDCFIANSLNFPVHHEPVVQAP